ncbi:hypothetical protein SNE40_003258 [Patella caerulea]|uniref:Uncharacterized protein n=1 Tax=Patella caerulea TaxID=87958 RepID=A0AAN8Q0P4_PATCE
MGTEKRKKSKTCDKVAGNDSTQESCEANERRNLVPDDGSSRNNLFRFKTFSGVRYIMIAIACIGMMLINGMRTNIGFTVLTILDEKAHQKLGTIKAITSVSIEISMFLI